MPTTAQRVAQLTESKARAWPGKMPPTRGKQEVAIETAQAAGGTRQGRTYHWSFPDGSSGRATASGFQPDP